MSARSAAAMAPVAEARCVPELVARNPCLFRAARFRAGPAHPVRRSLSEIPYLRPLEALLEEIGTIDELLDAAIRRAGHAAVDVDARANRRTGRAWAEERSGESLERVGQTVPRPRVRRRGSRAARTAEGPPAIGARAGPQPSLSSPCFWLASDRSLPSPFRDARHIACASPLPRLDMCVRECCISRPFPEDVTGTRLWRLVVDHDMSWADFSGAQITPDSHRCRQGSCQASKGQATGLKRGSCRPNTTSW